MEFVRTQDGFSRFEMARLIEFASLFCKEHPEQSWKVTLLSPIISISLGLSVYSIYGGCNLGLATGICAIISGLFSMIFCMREFAVNGSTIHGTIALFYKTFVVLTIASTAIGIIGSILSARLSCSTVS